MAINAEAAIEREIEAYRQMHPNLLKSHLGKYVAIYQGQLVDHDQDRLALYLRIDNQYPDVPVLMRPVRPQVDRIINIRSPRLERTTKREVEDDSSYGGCNRLSDCWRLHLACGV